MHQPLFSVIIPAYNAAATLRSAVASVFAQSEQNLEIIIIDDGSHDDTLHVMLDLGVMDERIRVVSQSNAGVSRTRNYAAGLAKGELLAFLDADDQWASDKLAHHRAFHARNPQIAASFAKVGFCQGRGAMLGADRSTSSVPGGDLSIGHVIVENAVCTMSNLVIDREVFNSLGGFDAELRHAEDQEFLARLIRQGFVVRGIDQTLVRYRMSEDGLSCDFEAMFAGWKSFASHWIAPEDLARAEAVYCRYLTRRALRSGASFEVAASLAQRGLAAHRSTFLGSYGKGLITLCGVVASSAMPVAMRRTVFA